MTVGCESPGLPWRGSRLRPLWQRDLPLAPDTNTGPASRPRAAASVLIVEDDVLIASQMEAALSEAGFDVLGPVATGEEAMAIAASERPDLAVVDLRLAGNRDGVDTALELLRSHGIRCIFATAYSDPEAHARAKPADPLGWLHKPYTMASLTSMVCRSAAKLRGKGG